MFTTLWYIAEDENPQTAKCTGLKREAEAVTLKGPSSVSYNLAQWALLF